MRRIDLLQIRDARYYPAPWYEFVLIDVDRVEILGWFKTYVEAENEMLLWIEEPEEDAAA